jgi:hypothetical protein
LVFHKKTVLVEESPMASVPPLGSAGSTGPQDRRAEVTKSIPPGSPRPDAAPAAGAPPVPGGPPVLPAPLEQR